MTLFKKKYCFRPYRRPYNVEILMCVYAIKASVSQLDPRYGAGHTVLSDKIMLYAQRMMHDARMYVR